MSELPLHSDEAEKTIIASVLLDYTNYRKVNLLPDDFYSARNKQIWQVITELFEGSITPDIVSVSNKLGRGALAELTGLVAECITTANIEDIAVIVREKAHRRNVLNTLRLMTTQAYDEKCNFAKAVSEGVSKIVAAARPEGGAESLRRYVSALYDEIGERAENPVDIWGIPSGFVDIDRITGGWQVGETVLWSGEPGVGKSLLLMQMAYNMAGYKPGAIYAMEMNGLAISRRLVSGISGVDTYRLRTGKLEDGDWSKIILAMGQLDRRKMFLSDETNWTTAGIRADLARLKEQEGIEWFVIDYLGLLADTYGKDENERGAYISKQMHNIAKDLRLCGLLIESMTKEGMRGDVGKVGIAGSAKKLHDADQIVVITKDQSNPNLINLKWEKIREGADGLRFAQLIKRPGIPLFQNYKRG